MKLPGSIAISGPTFSAAAGGGSKMSLGSDAVAISSKKVTIEAEGVCKLRGKKALKLQESESVKAKGAVAGTGEKGPGAKDMRGKRGQPLPDDDATAAAMVALHNGGQEPTPDDGNPQGLA